MGPGIKRQLPPGFDLKRHMAELDEAGFTVIEDYLEPGADRSSSARGWRPTWAPTAAATRSRATPPSGSTRWSDAAQVFEESAADPRLLAILDRLLRPNYLLSANHAICIYPGENAQNLHFDDGFYPFPRPAAGDQDQHHRRDRRLHAPRTAAR